MSTLKGSYNSRMARAGIDLVEDVRDYLSTLPSKAMGGDSEAAKLAKRCDEWLDWAAWEDKE